jgi:hypothetical protein
LQKQVLFAMGLSTRLAQDSRAEGGIMQDLQEFQVQLCFLLFSPKVGKCNSQNCLEPYTSFPV